MDDQRFLELFDAYLEGRLDGTDLRELYFLINSGQFNALMEARTDQSFQTEVLNITADEAWRDHVLALILAAIKKK